MKGVLIVKNVVCLDVLNSFLNDQLLSCLEHDITIACTQQTKILFAKNITRNFQKQAKGNSVKGAIEVNSQVRVFLCDRESLMTFDKF